MLYIYQRDFKWQFYYRVSGRRTRSFEHCFRKNRKSGRKIIKNLQISDIYIIISKGYFISKGG